MQEHTCAACGGAKPNRRNKYCSRECASRGQQQFAESITSPTRRALRAAVSDDDVIEAVRLGTTPNRDGCWIWAGKSSRGYPTINPPIGGEYLLHRAVLSAKLGAPLGEQTAHHTCANNRCVNPAHLQQATHRENVGEMLARRDYIRRIELLESALREYCPDHPLLDESPLGGIASP